MNTIRTQHEQGEPLAFANERVHLAKLCDVQSVHRHVAESENLFAEWFDILRSRGQVVHEVSNRRCRGEQRSPAGTHLCRDLEIYVLAFISLDSVHNQLNQVIRWHKARLLAFCKALLNDWFDDPVLKLARYANKYAVS